MGDYVFESGEDSPPSGKLTYDTISTHTAEEDAVTALHCVDSSEYKHLRTYGPARRRTSLYHCISHASCQRKLRIIKTSLFAPSGSVASSTFQVQAGGEHGLETTGRKRTGVDMAIKPEVDSILRGGAGPKRCRLILLQKYAKDKVMLDKIPDEKMLKNRKASMKKSGKKTWDVSNFTVMMQWASSRMCTTPEVFFGTALGFEVDTDKATFAQKDLEFQNELIILKTFDHKYTGEDNKEATSFGFIFTSRRLFRNVYYSVLAQTQDGVAGLTDGTYRIDFNRWTLVCFGTACGLYDQERRTYRRSYVPWVYMFVRTEHEYAYKVMLSTVVEFAARFFGITLELKYGSQDHASYIANAYTQAWPGVKILNCYPHLARKAFEKTGLLKNPNFYKTDIEKNIHELELARSPEQFLILAEKCTQYWTSQKEGEYAQWFRSQYLGERWGTWFTTVAAPGVMPSQNPIESHHQVLKIVCFPSKHAATSVVLSDTLPAVLYLDCDRVIKSFGHFAEGPVVGEMVEHARIFAKNQNYLKLKDPEDDKVVTSIVFNSWDYAVRPGNNTGQKVTKTRAARYLDSKLGRLRKGSRVPDFQLYYMSMHEVKFFPLARSTPFKLELSPIVPSHQICAIRSRYQCDCKGFWSSGWICSHIIAALSLMDEYDLKTATAHLPTRKKSGGQRKIRNALQPDDTGFFAVAKLERDLVKKTLHANWMERHYAS